MKKRLFQVLDEMNVMDIENGTQFLSVGGDLVSADLVKAGAKICMGSHPSAITDIMNNKVIPVLLLIDAETYNALIK